MAIGSVCLLTGFDSRESTGDHAVIAAKMTSAERVFAALEGGTPDRAPVAEMFIDPKVIDTICPGMGYDDFVEPKTCELACLKAMEKIVDHMLASPGSCLMNKAIIGAVEHLTDDQTEALDDLVVRTRKELLGGGATIWPL